VFGKSDIGFILNVVNDSFKDLTVSKLPESHWEHNVGNQLDEVQGQHSHLFVECGWFSVVVAHEKSLVDVQDDEGDTGDRIQRRHCATVAEGDADLK